MKIVALSDTHMGHRDVKLPDGDILIHAGDATFLGTKQEIREFNAWLGDLPFKHKIFVAGNHDRMFQVERTLAQEMLTNAIYLQDSMVEIEGLKIYGSPWQPAYNNWAFNVWTDEELARIWANIPPATDILVTHCPPAGILDGGLGCRNLRARLEVVKPKLHLFGHIHRGHGRMDFPDGISANVSIMDENYDLKFRPTEINTDYEAVFQNGLHKMQAVTIKADQMDVIGQTPSAGETAA